MIAGSPCLAQEMCKQQRDPLDRVQPTVIGSRRRRSLRQNANTVSRRQIKCEGSRTSGTGSSNPSPSSRGSCKLHFAQKPRDLGQCAESARPAADTDSSLEGSGFERWVPRDMGYGFGPSCLRHPRRSSSAARREHPAAPAALNVVGTPAPIPSLTRSRSALCLQVRPQSLPSDAASHRACQSREAGDNMSAKGMIGCAIEAPVVDARRYDVFCRLASYGFRDQPSHQ